MCSRSLEMGATLEGGGHKGDVHIVAIMITITITATIITQALLLLLLLLAFTCLLAF